MLLVLREIYALHGIAPKIPGADIKSPQQHRAGPPPKATYHQPGSGSPYAPSSSIGGPPTIPGYPSGPPAGPPSGYGTNNSAMRTPSHAPPHMYTPGSIPTVPLSGPSLSGPPSMGSSSNFNHSSLPPLSGPPPFSVQSTSAPVGPPPMAGFMKKT